jgi:hypothetical protein
MQLFAAVLPLASAFSAVDPAAHEASRLTTYNAYKAAHPERFTHEWTHEDIKEHMTHHISAAEVAAWKTAHPEFEHQHHEHHNYTAVEVAAWKAAHPEFEHRSHLDAIAKIAKYMAAHPERFERFGRSEAEEPPIPEHETVHNHTYSATELAVFAAGMAHAKQVEGYKATHASEFTTEAIAAYKAAHPARTAAAATMEATVGAELNVFRAGFEHYKTVVAPYVAEHPLAFSGDKVAEYIFQHPDRFSDRFPNVLG